MEEIPLSLILNWDQTGINFVPVSEWMMDVKGTRRVEIAGLKDKRQMTAVFAGSADGNFLPPQLIYPGSTAKSQPKNIKFPTEWHVTQTANIDKIIVPYVENKRKELNLPDNYPALALFDHFSGQITSKIFSKLDWTATTSRTFSFPVHLPIDCNQWTLVLTSRPNTYLGIVFSHGTLLKLKAK